jgi:predicted RNA-binding protein with PUA domain
VNEDVVDMMAPRATTRREEEEEEEEVVVVEEEGRAQATSTWRLQSETNEVSGSLMRIICASSWSPRFS